MMFNTIQCPRSIENITSNTRATKYIKGLPKTSSSATRNKGVESKLANTDCSAEINNVPKAGDKATKNKSIHFTLSIYFLTKALILSPKCHHLNPACLNEICESFPVVIIQDFFVLVNDSAKLLHKLVQLLAVAVAKLR